MTNKNAQEAIEKLLFFAQDNGMIEELDAIYSRNLLLDIMQEKEPCELKKDSYELPKTAAPILKELLEIAVDRKLINNTITEKDLFDTRLMNAIMPRPSEVSNRFDAICKNSGVGDATDWFYKLNKSCEYIRRNRIDKNIKWEYQDDKYGTLQITINMSKPEKDPNEIKKLLTMPKSGYPSCVLCKENMGYAGRLNHSARQTLRLLPLSLNNEKWYMQYSPYVYFNEHCIVLKHEHSPMLVNRDSIIRLLDFVDNVPHYFIGSNAGLPIVGGSILNHDHYQGGKADLPMAKASIKKHLSIKDYKDVDCGIVNWPMNCIRLTSPNRATLTDAANHILTSWEIYADPGHGIINNVDGIKHNAITPYARMVGSDYQIDLVLRNNVTTEDLPLGVYHPHPELFHIKKENIGLIEVMGLFILPGRLEVELELIQDILSGKTPYDKSQLSNDEMMSKHLPWIERLVTQNGTSMKKEDITILLQDEIGKICRKVLECSGVYKDTDDGHEGLMRFLESAGVE